MRVSNLALLLLLTSCSSALVDLSVFSVKTWPSQPNQVLDAADTVRVTFSSPVDRNSAQSLLSVSSVDGVAAGDLVWSGNTLTFTPVPTLLPSKRYSLEYSGQVTLTDGRRINVVKVVPFFSQNASAGLLVTSYSPASGATATLTQPLVLGFDGAVDQASFTQGFSVSPTAAFTAVWSADSRTVTVTPQTWASNTVVSWQLSTAVKSVQGSPLVSPVSHTFITNFDQLPPTVISLVPAVAAGSGTVTWSAAGSSLDGLQNGDALLLTMSEAVSLPSLAGALHITPAVKGHWDTQSAAPPYEYVFIPEDDWSPGTAYSLQLSGLQDLAGNSLPSPYLVTFTPAVPHLSVTGITLTGTSEEDYGSADLNKANFFPPCPPFGVGGALQIAVTLAFSEPFSASDKVQFAQLSFCEPLFPTEGATLATPSLVTVSFNGDTTAVLTYRGFSVGTASAPDYYRVRVPGGPSGLKTQAGNTLKEDVWLNFTTGS